MIFTHTIFTYFAGIFPICHQLLGGVTCKAKDAVSNTLERKEKKEGKTFCVREKKIKYDFEVVMGVKLGS